MSQEKLGDILDGFRRYCSVSEENYAQLKEESGKRLIGYTLGDVPIELIHAAGFLPVGVFGWSKPVGEGAAYLPSFSCSLMRTTLDVGLSEAAGSISGMIVAHICDTTRDFSGIWQRHVNMDFFHDWLPPKQMKRASAKVYVTSEINRLKEHLEEFSGHTISESDLMMTFGEYEKQRELLKDLKTEFLAKPGIIKAIDFYSVLRASVFIEVESYNRRLERLLKEIRSTPQPLDNSKVSVIICGKIPAPMEVIQIIEEAGATIRDDDLLLGSKLLRQILPSEGSPLDRLAQRFLSADPFPGYLYEEPARRDFLLKLVDVGKTDGVIFWNIKFCEPYNFDYPDLKKDFEKKGIPTLLLETEMHPSGIEQLKTRIQAFCEGLIGRQK